MQGPGTCGVQVAGVWKAVRGRIPRTELRVIHRPIEQLRDDAAAGTPAEVVERLQAYAEAGAQRCYLQLIDLDDLDHLALLAAEVMPHLA